MKKLISFLLVSVFLLSGFSIYANETKISAGDEKQVSIETHEKYKDQKAVTSEKQKDLLRALGMNEEQVQNATYCEISNLLNTGTIVDYSFVAKYDDSEAVQQDMINLKNYRTSHLAKLGYSADEIEIILLMDDINPLNIKKSDESAIKQKIQKESSLLLKNNSNALMAVPPPEIDGNFVVFKPGSEVHTLLEEKPGSTLKFPKQAFTQGVNPLDAYLLYDEALMWKNNVRNHASILYGGTTGVDYCYNLFAEETDGIIHRGTDIKKSDGATLYCSTFGTISQKGNGKISIYNSYYDVTFTYLHLNVSSNLAVGQSISKYTILGTEHNISMTEKPIGAHTHVEVRTGNSPGAQTSNGNYPTNPVVSPYNYFRYFN